MKIVFHTTPKNNLWNPRKPTVGEAEEPVSTK